jgi:hypothetical protein
VTGYQVVPSTNAGLVAAQQPFSLQAVCPVGKVVVGGGFFGNGGIVESSRPVNERTWSVQGHAGENGALPSAYAVCVNVAW